jgi:hypothetical protein
VRGWDHASGLTRIADRKRNLDPAIGLNSRAYRKGHASMNNLKMGHFYALTAPSDLLPSRTRSRAHLNSKCRTGLSRRHDNDGCQYLIHDIPLKEQKPTLTSGRNPGDGLMILRGAKLSRSCAHPLANLATLSCHQVRNGV